MSRFILSEATRLFLKEQYPAPEGWLYVGDVAVDVVEWWGPCDPIGAPEARVVMTCPLSTASGSLFLIERGSDLAVVVGDLETDPRVFDKTRVIAQFYGASNIRYSVSHLTIASSAHRGVVAVEMEMTCGLQWGLQAINDYVGFERKEK